MTGIHGYTPAPDPTAVNTWELTVNGSGGTFKLTTTKAAGGPAGGVTSTQTVALAYDANAATIDAALPTGWTVTGTTTKTITGPKGQGLSVSDNSVTGGTGPALTQTIVATHATGQNVTVEETTMPTTAAARPRNDRAYGTTTSGPGASAIESSVTAAASANALSGTGTTGIHGHDSVPGTKPKGAGPAVRRTP